MGNNPSSASKPTTPVSSAGTSTPAGVASHDAHAHSQSQTPSPLAPSSSTQSSPRHSRRDTRTIISPHSTQRSVAPPEASLAQAHGSTTVVSRPKSIPGTAVSSLSGSPHSNASGPTPIAASSSHHHHHRHQGSAGGTASASGSYTMSSGSANAGRGPEPHPAAGRDEPSKPVPVPVSESSSLRSHNVYQQPHAHYNSDMGPQSSDQNLVGHGSVTDMYLMQPPRLPLPIEEEIHTPGSPILPPEEGDDQDVPEVQLVNSSDALTRKSSGLSAGTVEEEDSDELRVDKDRPLVPTKLFWKRGGDKIYVTGTIFQWNRKHRLHPV
jgi:hypothetical protein